MKTKTKKTKPKSKLKFAPDFTPGPWHHESGIFKHYISSDNGDLQLSIQEMHPVDGHDVPAAANARLIAAAPSMYAALREWVRYREVAIGGFQGSEDRSYKIMTEAFSATIDAMEIVTGKKWK